MKQLIPMDEHGMFADYNDMKPLKWKRRLTTSKYRLTTI